MHLDTIRKSCEKNPSLFLGSFDRSKLSATVKTKIVVAAKASKTANEDTEGPVNFDGLEDMEAKEKVKTEGGTSTSLFSSFSIGGSKASKFRVDS
jgi:uncharacterized protein YwgA